MLAFVILVVVSYNNLKLSFNIEIMIGGLFPRRDIDIFLTKEEIEQLSSQTIKGKLIRHDKPVITHSLSLSVFEDIGIDVAKHGNSYLVFLPNENYKMLKENRHFGTRYNGPYNKIEIVEESYANENNDLLSELRGLRKRLENPMKFM